MILLNSIPMSQVSLMDEAGNTKDDLRLPTDDELAKEIQTAFDDGKELVVTVLKARSCRELCS